MALEERPCWCPWWNVPVPPPASQILIAYLISQACHQACHRALTADKVFLSWEQESEFPSCVEDIPHQVGTSASCPCVFPWTVHLGCVFLVFVAAWTPQVLARLLSE